MTFFIQTTYRQQLQESTEKYFSSDVFCLGSTNYIALIGSDGDDNKHKLSMTAKTDGSLSAPALCQKQRGMKQYY